jgi:hypothetical protein
MLMPSSVALASEGSFVSIQGIVMGLDAVKGIMIVNEKTFLYGPGTTVCDEKGTPTTADKLRINTWVYIEGMKQGPKKRVKAEKIYILPKFVQEKEKHLYPFMR